MPTGEGRATGGTGGTGGAALRQSEWLSRSTLLALAAMALATLVIAIDFTAFSVALPSMERDLHASLATVQWVINAYAVVFGVVIVTGGRLADMLGGAQSSSSAPGSSRCSPWLAGSLRTPSR